MAELIPHPDLVGPVPYKKREEYKTAELLAKYLPPTFKIFHSVHWATQNCDKTFLGEIDFIILNPLGRLLLIEQKNGGLQEGKEGLTKLYGVKQKSVQMQMMRSVENLLTAFESRNDKKLDVDMLLYCPDYLVQNKSAAGIVANRIVDQRDAYALPDLVLNIFAERSLQKHACNDVELITQFLSNKLNVRYDIGFLGKLAKSAYIEQAAGLSEWIRKMSGVPFRVVVDATAGSGKTQLALDEIRDALDNNEMALYVCFNRNLAIEMRKATGLAETCTTFHELARFLYESKGFPFQPGVAAFDSSVQYFIDHADEMAGSFDVLLIDEAQDFEATWLEALFKLCKSKGRLIALMDNNQRLYTRSLSEFDGWIKIDHQVTYRCPRFVTDQINEFELTSPPITSRSVVEGLPSFLEYYDAGQPESLVRATSSAVEYFLNEGHSPEEIVVLTFRGAENSELLKATELAGHALIKTIGRTAEGDFEYSQGTLIADTVFRFKGRSANCVVVSEVDFEQLDDNSKRRLFVGMTRARLRLALVITKRAGQQMLKESGE